MQDYTQDFTELPTVFVILIYRKVLMYDRLTPKNLAV